MPKREDLGHFVAIFRGSLRSVRAGLLTIVTAVVVGVAIGLFRSDSVDKFMKAGPELILVALGAAAVLALFAWFHCVRFYIHGIEGKSFWSLPVRFYWTQIEGYRVDSSNGIPAAVLTSRDSEKEMWIFRDVFERDEFQHNLRTYLDFESPAHVD